jgi:hypothetical protein
MPASIATPAAAKVFVQAIVFFPPGSAHRLVRFTGRLSCDRAAHKSAICDRKKYFSTDEAML